jgi:hypothetical protein
MLTELLSSVSRSAIPLSISESARTQDPQLIAHILTEDMFNSFNLNQNELINHQQVVIWIHKMPSILSLAFMHPKRHVETPTKPKPEVLSQISGLQHQNWMPENKDQEDALQIQQDAALKNLKNARYLWRPLFSKSNAEVPPYRSKHTCVQHGGFVYLFAGRGKHANLKDLWVYDIGTNTWEQINVTNQNAPPFLLEHSAVVHQGQMHVFGGAFSNESKTPLWTFDFNTRKWHDASSNKDEKKVI